LHYGPGLAFFNQSFNLILILNMARTMYVYRNNIIQFRRKLMRTKHTLILVSFISMIAFTPVVFADKEIPHQVERQDMPGSGKHFPKSEEIYKSETADLNKVREQINLMQEQMDAIHAEKDLDKRKALMQEHKKTMHKAMGMMPNDYSLKHQEERQDMPGSGKHLTRQMSPDRRVDLMENYMATMQQMMNQMMQRQEIPHQPLRQDMPGSDKHMKSKH